MCHTSHKAILDRQAVMCFNGVMTNEPEIALVEITTEMWFCSIWAYQDMAAWPLPMTQASEALELMGITLVEEADAENGCWLVSVHPELNEKLNLGLQVDITHRLSDGTKVEIQIHSDINPSDGS